MLVPVPQYNPFEKLDHRLAHFGDRAVIDGYWDRFAEERNGYLEGIEAELVAHILGSRRGGGAL
jgi:hypothetical protein